MVEAFSQTVRKASLFQWIASGLILGVIAFVLMVPHGDMLGHYRGWPLDNAHTIGIAMFQYAQDHNGTYPTGKSSTEVFQKLMDEGYVSVPSLFYCAQLKIPDKVPPTSKQLRPENVCWDVTIPLDTNSDDHLPMVFSTGYKINYASGGNAVPLLRGLPGIAVCYHSNSATYAVNDNLPDGIVTNFISRSFNSGGKTYQQLTPDGPLPP